MTDTLILIHYIGKSDTFQTLEADAIFSPHINGFVSHREICVSSSNVYNAFCNETYTALRAHTHTHTHTHTLRSALAKLIPSLYTTGSRDISGSTNILEYLQSK